MNKKQDEQKHFRLLLFLQNCDIFICDTIFSYELCTNAYCDAFISIKVYKCIIIFFYFCCRPWKVLTVL